MTTIGERRVVNRPGSPAGRAPDGAAAGRSRTPVETAMDTVWNADPTASTHFVRLPSVSVEMADDESDR